MTDLALDLLPPGPRLPVFVQTAAWVARPWDFMERCAARYGDTFTLRLAGERPWVMVSHPDAVKEAFTGPPELLHAGEGNRILLRWSARTRCCCSTMTHIGSIVDCSCRRSAATNWPPTPTR